MICMVHTYISYTYAYIYMHMYVANYVKKIGWSTNTRLDWITEFFLKLIAYYYA